jgi:hypothetical protein
MALTATLVAVCRADVTWPNNNFCNCFDTNENGLIFKNSTSSSTINYLYTTPALYSSLVSSNIELVFNMWTDHALLLVKFKLIFRIHGKGVQCINAHFVNNLFFVSSLTQALDQLLQTPSGDLSPPTTSGQGQSESEASGLPV